MHTYAHKDGGPAEELLMTILYMGGVRKSEVVDGHTMQLTWMPPGWQLLRTFWHGPSWEQSGDWSFGQSPSAGYLQGQQGHHGHICRGPHWQNTQRFGEPNVSAGTGPDRRELALCLHGPTALGVLCVAENSAALQRPPECPHCLQNYMASGDLAGITGAYPWSQEPEPKIYFSP